MLQDFQFKKIIVFGDSILKGAITGTGSGNLFDITENDSLSIIQKKFGFELQNESVFGSTSTKALKKIRKYFEKSDENSASKADLCIIEFGSNDSDYNWEEINTNPDLPHNAKVPVEQYIQNISQIISTCREHEITPLLMTLPPLVTQWWFEHISTGYSQEQILMFLGAKEKLYQNQERYNLELMDLCLKMNVQFVDMRKAFLSYNKEQESYTSLMCKDGIHPNEKGYFFMSEIWEDKLPGIKKEF